MRQGEQGASTRYINEQVSGKATEAQSYWGCPQLTSGDLEVLGSFHARGRAGRDLASISHPALAWGRP